MAGCHGGDRSADRSVLSRQENVRVLLAEVTNVDLAKRRVETRESLPLDYDYLVVATVRKAATSARRRPRLPGLKDLDDAVEIRRRVLVAFEAAEREPDPTCSAAPDLRVIGGGPTGGS